MRHSGEDGVDSGVGTLGKCRSPDQIDFLASLRVVCLTFLRPFHSVRLLRLLTLYGFIAHLTEMRNGGYVGVRGVQVVKCLSNKYICLILFSPTVFRN